MTIIAAQIEMIRVHRFARILIVGGGTTGIRVLNVLSSRNPHGVTILEPFSVHYHPPIFSRSGLNVFDLASPSFVYPRDLPKDSTWVPDSIAWIHPEENKVYTKTRGEIQYTALVLALGLEWEMTRIKGLEEGLASNNVVTDSIPMYSGAARKALEEFDGGDIIFAQSQSASCFPQSLERVAYIADDLLRLKGMRQSSSIAYTIPPQDDKQIALDAIGDEFSKRGIRVLYSTQLVSIPSRRTAEFMNTVNGKQFLMDFDLLYVTLPLVQNHVLKSQGPPLTTMEGWIDIDHETLCHKKYRNVFALGDCSSLLSGPNQSLLNAQVNVIAKNVDSFLKGNPLIEKMDPKYI